MLSQSAEVRGWKGVPTGIARSLSGQPQEQPLELVGCGRLASVASAVEAVQRAACVAAQLGGERGRGQRVEMLERRARRGARPARARTRAIDAREQLRDARI